MHYYSTSPSSNMGIIAHISKAINGEYSAIYCYEQLASQTFNSEIKDRILEIRNDEIKHYQMFSHIYISLTEKQPTPQITEPCPTGFKNGVLTAFKDEQETVDFYHEIARKSNDPHIREAFLEAAADEQNHAVWFLYFMNHH